MADVRNFRKYIEELSGNNMLLGKMKTLERRNEKLSAELAEIKAELKLIKKTMAKPVPKPKGRKPRPIIRIIEDELKKKNGQSMKVTEIVKILKKKKIKTKARSLYTSVAASMANSSGRAMEPRLEPSWSRVRCRTMSAPGPTV